MSFPGIKKRNVCVALGTARFNGGADRLHLRRHSLSSELKMAGGGAQCYNGGVLCCLSPHMIMINKGVLTGFTPRVMHWLPCPERFHCLSLFSRRVLGCLSFSGKLTELASGAAHQSELMHVSTPSEEVPVMTFFNRRAKDFIY